jgi:cell fate regulator YaaT (PSP1 superfamily)
MVVELPQHAAGHAHGGCNPNGRCGNGMEKIYPTCAVRYGYMKHIGEFSYAPGTLFGCRERVVVETDRGIEIGEQVSLTCSGCDKSISRDQMRAYAQNSGADFYRLKNGRILRVATSVDLLEERKINEEAEEKLEFARRLVRERRMPMKMVTCEQLFGGERIIYYYMSEVRVDFRELVRDLNHEYHTRVEMRQIGHRDEARLTADYEICGRECCCKNFLKTLRPVSMQMAKLQKSTLDPSKVSGRCGRLRCCLRYEHEGYTELNNRLPRIGLMVRVGEGLGTVVDRQVLTQLVMLEFEGGKRRAYPVEDLLDADPSGSDEMQPPDGLSSSADRIDDRPGVQTGHDTDAAGNEAGRSSRSKRRRRRRSGRARPGPAGETPTE